MRVMVLGATGMLGHKMVQVLREQFAFEVFGTTRAAGVDARDFCTVAEAIAVLKPQAIVNCIGIIKQLDAAKDPIASLEVNSLFPHRLARLCRAASIRLVHISTDCVFSGTRGMYTEGDTPDAVDLYGTSKRLGEVVGEGVLTLRTSIIGRELGTRNGLVEWFASNRGGKVKGFSRAIFSGFTTEVLSGIVGEVLKDYPGLHGLYHVSSAIINKHRLLCMLNDAAGLDVEIEEDYSFVCDRSLDSTRFCREVNYSYPSWKEMINDLAREFLLADAKEREIARAMEAATAQ